MSLVIVHTTFITMVKVYTLSLTWQYQQIVGGKEELKQKITEAFSSLGNEGFKDGS